MRDEFAILFIIAALIVGLLIGMFAADGDWSSDCSIAGMHRDGKQVYSCSKR